MPDAVAALISAGPLGAIIVTLAIAYWRKDQQHKQVQEARVEDAKKVVGTLLELNNKWHAVVNDLVEHGRRRGP